MTVSMRLAHRLVLPTGNFLVEEVIYNIGEGERFEKTVLQAYARADTGLRGAEIMRLGTHDGHGYVGLHSPVSVYFDVPSTREAFRAREEETTAHHAACLRLARALIQTVFPRLHPLPFDAFRPQGPVWEHPDGSVILDLPRTRALAHLQPLTGMTHAPYELAPLGGR